MPKETGEPEPQEIESEEMEPVEVEELGENTDLPAPETPQHQLEDLEDVAYILVMKEKYRRGPIPVVITNPSLIILWHNEAFCRLFNPGEDSSGQTIQPPCRDDTDPSSDKPTWQGEYLTRVLSPSTGETGAMDIYRKLRSREYSFSWQGHIEGDRKDKRKLLAHLMLMPLFGSRDNPHPKAYIGLLNDLSLYHHQMMRNTFTSLLEASKMKDNDTGNHIQRVNEYSQMITHQLFGHPDYPEIDIDFMEDIGFLAAMHDVGKIGTPDDILNKTGKLNDWEWDIMREHTINGAYILSNYPNPMARDIALFHHERWNGRGYPYGLRESAIPLAARIVALADVYDALRMERSYKPSFSHPKAAAIILEDAGSHFDPQLCRWFEELQNRFEDIFNNLQD